MIEKTEPMFPRYLFIHVDIHEFSPMKIRSTRGISRVIGHGEKWNIVPAELIYQLMRNEDSDELRDVVSRLPKYGQQVLIEEGPFKGLQAIYQEPDGELRAILLLSFLNQDISDSFDNKSYRCMAS
jgi:transcriptional antiterminator RfaH